MVQGLIQERKRKSNCKVKRSKDRRDWALKLIPHKL